jgi:hypothetical protein
MVVLFGLMKFLNIAQNILAAGGVQARGRLVEHQHVRLHGDDACDGHAALLAAGELERRACEVPPP